MLLERPYCINFLFQILDFAAPYFCTEASNSRNVFFHYNLISKC